MPTAEKFDIVVVGSCNVDLISYVKHFPKAGETLCGSKFTVGCGGKGANQCVMAAKLGANTAMLGCVGDDNFGEMYMKNFNELGVDTTYMRVVEGVSTGVAPIAVNEQGENSIIIVKGANDCITMEDLQRGEGALRGASVVIVQLEISLEITLEALKMARRNNVRTIFNPAPAVENLSKEFLQNTSILCCNETEAEILTGSPVDNQPACESAVKTLLGLGPKCVILTLGAKGAMFATSQSDSITYVSPDPSSVTAAVDSTGAGDSFVGSLAYFLSQHPNLSLEETVRRSVAIASISVQKPGTQTSYPTKDELPTNLFS